ncbi:MAG: DNA polymerase I [Caldimicrobium sp.]
MSLNKEELQKRALLIDGSSFIYRAYFAIPGYLATSKGLPTKAIFGITQMLLKILKEWDPKIIVWFMDEKAPTFRHIQFEEYKATRPGMPDELKIQIPYIKKIVSALGIPIVSAEGFEADDLIATFIETFQIPVIMIAPDKDLLSLINERVLAFDPIRDNITDMESFKNKYGFLPSSFPDFRALVGDPSDNIKGVPGIGEKTAKDLILKYQSLANLFENLANLPDKKLKIKLLEHKDKIFRNLELMKLRKDAPLPSSDLNYYYRKEPDYQRLKELFKFLEFKKFLKEFNFPEETPQKIQIEEVSCESLLKLLREENPEKIALIIEKSSIGLFLMDQFNLYLATSPNRCYSSTIKGAFSKEITNREIILWDYKNFLHQVGERIYKPFDVKISAYLLNPTFKNYQLSTLVFEYLDRIYSEKSTDTCEKTALLYQLGEVLQSKIKEEGLNQWLERVEIPLSFVLYSMEKRGVKIDIEYVKNLKSEFMDRLKALEEKLYEMAGKPFNPRSSQEVAHILFDKLNLPKIKKTQKSAQPSTDAEVLEELYHHHPIVPALLQYRTLYKLVSTYLDVFLKEVSPKNFRLYTEFNQTGTATGRLSSQKPNLQNIPIRGEEGLAIRRAIIAEEGHYILSLDYSQIELRILAHFSQDENLISAFERGEDIHSFTASEIFGVEQEKITPEMRRVAKIINFGIAYGMSPYGLSKELKIDPRSAELYIQKYFSRYPGVKTYTEKIIELAKNQGYVQTISGRKRFIPEIFSPDKNVREFGKRIAINTPIQGSAADLIKAAMVALFNTLEKEGLKSKLILQVHDELLLETPEDELEKVITIAQNIMEDPFPYLNIDLKISVPIKVNYSFGKTWADCK